MANYNDNEDQTTARPVLEMLTVANEYCLFFEKADTFQTEDILNYFRKIAPLLYLKASTLPTIHAADESFAERFVTEEQWEHVFKTLREKFADDDVYYTLDHNQDTQEASLSDNMADIYQDMKDFVMLYQKGTLTARENAVYQVVQLMISRWGPVLIDALRTCHVKVFKNLTDDEGFDEDINWLV